MTGNGKPPVLVVVELNGGNDFMNTLVPYTSSIYYDNRPAVSVPREEVLPIDDSLGFHPTMGPFKDLYDEGRVAVIQGIGYPNSVRSHFRGMDIWHTCEPDRISTEGWLGKTVRELDPDGENVLAGVNFGLTLPRAMSMPGVSVCSVGDLDDYGFMTGIGSERRRSEALEVFKSMYAPAIGTGPVMEYLAQTGTDALAGEEMLRESPARYSSRVEYGSSSIEKSLRDIARVHLAGLGTRIFFASQGGYDVHANENPVQPTLLGDLSRGIADFFQDLRDHDASEEVVMFVFTEFGRRIKDNGSGTDHGAGGGAFIIGERVAGGLYAEYPPLEPSQWENGEDLKHTIDYRGVYSTLLEQWLEVEAGPIVGGAYEQIYPFN